MLLMGILMAFISLGLVAIWRWGDCEVRPPWAPEQEEGPSSFLLSVRRYLWYVAVGMAAGLTSGLIMAGMGGRLAMRILAATASDGAQGRITEANEIVGEITLGGSINLIGFTGIIVGLPSAAAYLLIRRWLPKGRLGGATFGALLLLLFSTQIDPLRPDNVDFDLVGPGWLAVAIFIAMGLGHGMLLAAVAGRYSKNLPLVTNNKGVLARYIPAALVAPVVPAAILTLLVGGAYVLASRVRSITKLARIKRVTTTGQWILLILLVVALPNFLSAVIDIAGRP